MGSKIINATEVNEENALFHSVRVNGGQAITHGKDLSSCSQAGNAASQTLSQSRKTETEKAIGQRELSLQSEEGAAALRREEQNCRARMEGKECDWKNDSLSFFTDSVQKPQKLAPL